MNIPVLLFNPKDRSTMARRKKKTTRRRRRRKANPRMGFADAGFSLLGGVLVAGGTFLVRGTEMSKPAKAAVIGGVGLPVGYGIGWLSPPVGCGVIGGSSAVAAADLLEHFARGVTQSDLGAVNTHTGAATTRGGAVMTMNAPDTVTMRAVAADLPSGSVHPAFRGNMAAVRASL